MEKEPERELKYGWSTFKPRWLQIVNNAKCFLMASVFICIIQGSSADHIFCLLPGECSIEFSASLNLYQRR